MADWRVQLVPAKAALETREKLQWARDRALSLTPHEEPSVLSVGYGRNKLLRDEYVSWVNSYLAILAPPDDLLFKRNLPKPKTRAEAEHNHARAVWARVRDEARGMFGKAGDHVTDVFVTAAANSDREFTRDARRERFKR
jgi:hypothetical protein